ncbi:MAG: bifunctional oligoribonuclease/PAP phosphatase NrnA [Victivallales bacterium]|nr:bifunctional oligoribonuclease/PAP phosphatase NrnA [Victivallales bacterium]MCF7888919.1 bifunctional oligoribonuclease/PAP phosphatase NrnA [Victivallales bacterium]
MNNSEVAVDKLSEILNSSYNSLILTHEKPDGDAYGSVFALLSFLNDIDREATVFLPDEIPEKYITFIPSNGTLIKQLKELQLNSYDRIYCLDSSTKDRIGIPDEIRKILPEDKIVNIDHHSDNDFFGKINYVDSQACAVGEILYDVLSKIDDYQITTRTAEYMLMAMLTDTGGLRFDNTTSKVLYKTSLLINIGADYQKIIKRVFFQKAYALHMLESDLALNHLNWEYRNKFVYTYVSDSLLKKYDLTIKDIENVIDSYRVIKGVLIAALITRRENKFKISLRSNDSRFPVDEIAHRLDGGGHKLAAGCSLKTDKLEEVIKKLIPMVGELVSG